jgi:hypothetical protein
VFGGEREPLSAELSMIAALRRALERASGGLGMSESLVVELRGQGQRATGVARALLLGHPIELSMGPLLSEHSEEVAMLASLVVASTQRSTALVGARGREMSYTLEKWVKLRENAKLEAKVHRFRCLIASGVMGGVCGMIASIGPIIGSFDLSLSGTPVRPVGLVLAAAIMTILSSGMLGLFVSGRNFYLNIIASVLAFALVSVMVSPLTGFEQRWPVGIIYPV